MKILLTGGTGLIGSALVRSLIAENHQVLILSRRGKDLSQSNLVQTISWDGQSLKDGAHSLANVDAVINLAGENIGSGRWSVEKKARIYQSRMMTGQVLCQALREGWMKPSVLIQASAVGYYGEKTGDQIFDETSPAGQGFLAQVCRDWEASTRDFEAAGVRRVIVRTGIVLDKNSGALARMLLPYRYFLGGRLGRGTQWLPWIHLQDEVHAILFLLTHPDAQGIYNLCAPVPVTQMEFGKTLAAIYHRPDWLPVPEFVLRLVLGEMSSLVLDGQRAIPAGLKSLGYDFIHPELRPALADILLPQ